MIRVGLDTWLWTDTFTEDYVWVIKEMSRLGAKVIDFAIADPFSFPLEQAKALVKETGIEAVTSTTLLEHNNPISPDASIRKEAVRSVKKLVDVTRELGGKITAGVNYTASGYLTGKIRTRQEIDWSVACMKEAAAYAKDTSDVIIAVEPVKRFESHMINTAAQALDYIHEVDMKNVKIHLDTFHMNIEEASITDAIEMVGKDLVYLHLIENNRGVPGMGHIDWIGIYKMLKKIGFDGPATIETFNPQMLEKMAGLTYLWRKFGETPAELAEKGLKHLKAVETIVYG